MPSLTRSGRAPGRSSRRMLYVELEADGVARHLSTMRPISTIVRWLPTIPHWTISSTVRSAPGSTRDMEGKAQGYAIAKVVPEHLAEVRDTPG